MVAATRQQEILSQPNDRSGRNSRGANLSPKELIKTLGPSPDLNLLSGLARQSVVHAKQLDRDLIVNLAHLAAVLESSNIERIKPLDGKIGITAFFEASTRTRLSFESAIQRLDGKVLSVPDGQVTGIAKGESLADIGEMFNSYGDVVVMRHPDGESIDEIEQNLNLPLINAGNGSSQHPSQALLDWYALLKWRPELCTSECPANKRIHLGIVGTPGSMRSVKSFLRMSLTFVGAIEKITIISEMADPVGYDLAEPLENCPIPVSITNDIGEALPELDVVYMNSIAFLGDSYRQLDNRYKLTSDSNFKKDAVILHPLARRDELDESLDDTPRNIYFAQAAGAVFSRQALLICVLDRLNRLEPILSLKAKES